VANLNIGTRLNLAFGTMLALMAIVATIGLTRLDLVNRATEKIVTDNAKTALAQHFGAISRRNANYMIELFAYTDQADLDRIIAERKAGAGEVSKEIEELGAQVESAEGRALYEQVHTNRLAFSAANNTQGLIRAIAIYRISESEGTPQRTAGDAPRATEPRINAKTRTPSPVRRSNATRPGTALARLGSDTRNGARHLGEGAWARF